MTGARPSGGRAALVAGLGATQILAWGGTYFAPSVLGPAMERDLGLPTGGALAGVTLMLAVGATLAPRVGRALDAIGPRRVLAAGSVGLALGLALLAASGGPLTMALAWAALGVAGAMALSEAAQAALARGSTLASARRDIGTLALVSGACTLVAWPALAWLEARLGWRGALLAAAASQLAVALPIHLALLPDGPSGGGPRDTRAAARAGPLPLRLRLLSAALAAQVLATGGALPHAIAVLQDGMGLAREAAVALGALLGPAQVAARALDLAFGRHARASTLASAALLAIPVGLVLPLALSGTAGAAAFVAAFGLASGAMAVLRPACLIEVHGGTEGYATVAGRVMAPVVWAMALSPSLFTGLLLLGGAAWGMALALGASAVAALAGLGLLRAALRAAI